MRFTLRPKAGKKILLFLPIGLLLLFPLFLAFCWVRGELGWRAISNRTLELEAEARSRPRTRQVLRGEATPGNAWDGYTRAYLEIQKAWNGTGVPYDFEHYIPKIAKDRDPDTREFRDTLHSAYEHFKKGTAHTEAQYPFVWGIDSIQQSPKVVHSLQLASFMFAHARAAKADGRFRESAELFLDLLQFDGDWARNGSLKIYNDAYLNALGPLRELKAMALSGALPPDDLKELSRQLEVLESNLPTTEAACLNDLIIFVRRLGRFNWTAQFENQHVGWKRGFSKTLLYVDLVTIYERWTRGAAKMEDMTWDEVRSFWERIYAERRSLDLPTPTFFLVGRHQIAEWRRRETLAEYRLLRNALNYLVFGKLLDLEDPFGGRLRSSNENGALKLWSIGMDGVDQGGILMARDRTTGDIVIEIKVP